VDLAALLDPLGAACRQAGEAIRAIRQRGSAEAILLEALSRQAPGVPVIAEEEVAAGRIPDLADAFFLVDPLDGTREFVRGGNDYTVNIGLVVGGTPLLGMVLAPEQGRLWAGVIGGEAFVEDSSGRRKPLKVRAPGEKLVIVASKSHMNGATRDYLAAHFADAERVAVGSSLKFCLLAEGTADYYPRLSPTSEWDTAAGHAVLAAAGGRVDAPDGSPLRYGKPEFLNPGFAATAGFPAPPLQPYMPA
jgi:3'(2'), 5'-bisphosphate nucleotidase